MDRKLLDKFVSNQCTSNEIDEFFDWFAKCQTDSQAESYLFNSHWNNIKSADNPDKELSLRRLDKIHHTINLNHSEHLDNRTPKLFFEKRKRKLQIVMRVAAVILLPILTLLVYTHYFQPELYSLLNVNQKYEVVSPAGSRTQFELSDGTKVWLNHGSKMVYPMHFVGGTRTVHLIGEGYFDVAPDKGKPFIVEAQGMFVKAVGTSFNVKAYSDDIDFETTLESGKVIVLKSMNAGKTEVCTMKPGEHFVFNGATNKFSVKTENPLKYVSWKDGKLVFADDHLDDVAERLSRWYNVKITLKDPNLKYLTYTATFANETLDQVLEMMESITPISHSISKKYKLPDGTFTEKEILIYKKGGKLTKN